MPPKRKKLNVDDIEVHRALEDSDSDQAVIETDLVVLHDGSTIDMTEIANRAVARALVKAPSQFSSIPKPSLVELQPQGKSGSSFVIRTQPQVSVINGVQPQGKSGPSLVGLQGQGSVDNPFDLSDGMTFKPPHELSDTESDQSESDELDDVIGAGVNSQDDEDESCSTLMDQLFGKSPPKAERPGKQPIPQQTGGKSVPNTDPIPLNPPIGSGTSEPPTLSVDPDLPSLDNIISNWSPNPLVINWAKNCFDKFMTKDQIKKLEDDFVPDPTIKDLFSPIRSSDRLNKTMQSEATKAKDTFVFNRYDCEKRCFKAQQLMGLSYPPFLEALSSLMNVPGAGAARNLIGQGLMAVSSAFHEVSYARRELCRSLIKADIVPYLYSFPPTHNQLFGGESIDAQVKNSIEKAKQDGAYIYKPFKAKSSIQNKSSGFQNQGKAQNASKANRSKKRGRQAAKGKAKGKSQPKSSTTDTNN